MEKQKNNILRFNEFINESVESYDFTKTHTDKKLTSYTFTDASNNMYLVEFRTKNKMTELAYYVKDNNGNWSVSEITNSGNIFSITKTVYGSILRDFLADSDVSRVFITGVGKTLEKDYITQRTKVAYRYLNNNLSNDFKITLVGNKIFVDKI